MVRSNSGHMLPGSFQAGAICFSADDYDWGKNGHHTITIDDNRVEKARGVNIQVQFARDATITDNVFLDTHIVSGGGGTNFVDPSAVIWLDTVDDVHLSGNAVQSPYDPNYKSVLQNRDCTNITGTTGF